jgi:hypothetical protein
VRSAVVTSAVRLGFVLALLKDPDASMAMGIPMIWSVVEAAVGILVSSAPPIRAVRFLFRKSGEDSYGSGAPQSALRFRGHIQLRDVKSNVSDEESQKARHPDNVSEEYLVVNNAKVTTPGRTFKTTELEVSYSNM